MRADEMLACAQPRAQPRCDAREMARSRSFIDMFALFDVC